MVFVHCDAIVPRCVQCKSAEEFEQIAAISPRSHGDEPESISSGLHFVYSSMDGREIELCPQGREKPVTYAPECLSPNGLTMLSTDLRTARTLHRQWKDCA